MKTKGILFGLFFVFVMTAAIVATAPKASAGFCSGCDNENCSDCLKMEKALDEFMETGKWPEPPQPKKKNQVIEGLKEVWRLISGAQEYILQ